MMQRLWDEPRPSRVQNMMPVARLKGAEMNYEDLTPELMEKVRACKSAEELIELAKAEGADLTDEQIESISGGEAWFECSTRRMSSSVHI